MEVDWINWHYSSFFRTWVTKFDQLWRELVSFLCLNFTNYSCGLVMQCLSAWFYCIINKTSVSTWIYQGYFTMKLFTVLDVLNLLWIFFRRSAAVRAVDTSWVRPLSALPHQMPRRSLWDISNVSQNCFKNWTEKFQSDRNLLRLKVWVKNYSTLPLLKTNFVYLLFFSFQPPDKLIHWYVDWIKRKVHIMKDIF